MIAVVGIDKGNHPRGIFSGCDSLVNSLDASKTRSPVTAFGFNNNLRSARWLIDAIHQRSSTLLRVIQVVLEDARPAGEHELSSSESIEKEIILERTEEDIRRAVNQALDRIEEGIYGTCQQCGREIPQARLQAIPYTPYCINCERKLERQA